MNVRRLATALLAIALVAGCGAASPPSPTGGAATLPSPVPEPSASREPAAAEAPLADLEEAPIEAAPLPTTAPPSTGVPRVAKRAKPFAMDLYEPGDFVGQYTFEWCVGASLQMALLVMNERADRSRAYQRDLWRMARDRSDSPFGGANPIGWTAALNHLGIGPYMLVSRPTLDEAVRTAAEAIRSTKRPVGLVMWSGRHAWVMTGFESHGDPRSDPGFEVTGVRVLDPLYPHGSAIWGRSPRPDALVSPEALGRQFVPRLFGRVDYRVAPGYMLVLPTD